MNDEKLIKEFIQVKRDDHRTEIYVRTISWNGPYTPIVEWELYSTFDTFKSDSDLTPTLHAILNDKVYFNTCNDCGEKKPNGWMSEGKICHSCAEKNHGIVF